MTGRPGSLRAAVCISLATFRVLPPRFGSPLLRSLSRFSSSGKRRVQHAFPIEGVPTLICLKANSRLTNTGLPCEHLQTNANQQSNFRQTLDFDSSTCCQSDNLLKRVVLPAKEIRFTSVQVPVVSSEAPKQRSKVAGRRAKLESPSSKL